MRQIRSKALTRLVLLCTDAATAVYFCDGECDLPTRRQAEASRPHNLRCFNVQGRVMSSETSSAEERRRTPGPPTCGRSGCDAFAFAWVRSALGTPRSGSACSRTRQTVGSRTASMAMAAATHVRPGKRPTCTTREKVGHVPMKHCLCFPSWWAHARRGSPIVATAAVLASLSAWAQTFDPSDIAEGGRLFRQKANAKPATAGRAMAARWIPRCRTAPTSGRAP
jgi:hypothetical protein